MEHQNVQTMRRWFEEVWNQANQATMDEIMTENSVIHDGAVDTRGPAEFKKLYERIRAGFSNIHFTTHEGLADGDIAAIRWTATMTHSGEFAGFAATGRHVTITGMAIAREKDGEFVEVWQNWDMLGLIEQIRQAPKPAPTYMASA